MHRVNGKLQRLTIRDPQTEQSTYPDLTLAKARDLARAELEKASVGRDPSAERKQAKVRTFGKLCDPYLEARSARSGRRIHFWMWIRR